MAGFLIAYYLFNSKMKCFIFLLFKDFFAQERKT